MTMIDQFAPLREWRAALYRGAANIVSRFLELIDATLPSGWIRDSEYERTRTRPDRIRCYLFDRTGDASVRLWLQRVSATRVRGGPVQLIRHAASDEPGRVALLVAEFGTGCVLPATAKTGVRFTRPVFGLGSVLTPAAEMLFIRFADTADGEWPLTDQAEGLWDQLVSGCLTEQVAIGRAELSRWLADSGWEQAAVTARNRPVFRRLRFARKAVGGHGPMIAVAQAVADLIATPKPVLFLDTCTLLDIVRIVQAPQRDLTPTVRAGVELLALSAAGSVQLLVQDIVPDEWHENLPAARGDGERAVLAFTATWQIAADLGLPAPPLPVLPPGILIDELEKLSHELLTAANVLRRDHDGMSWAINRVASKKKPFSGNKGGAVKDCYILGHALRLSTLLADNGYAQWRVLVSSNRSDFAAPNAAVFHTDIATEAAAAGLRYAVSLEAAVTALRAAGEIP